MALLFLQGDIPAGPSKLVDQEESEGGFQVELREERVERGAEGHINTQDYKLIIGIIL